MRAKSPACVVEIFDVRKIVYKDDDDMTMTRILIENKSVQGDVEGSLGVLLSVRVVQTTKGTGRKIFWRREASLTTTRHPKPYLRPH